MVNVVKVMMQPYMVAGNLAKNCICGAGDLIGDILHCGNGNRNNNNRGCGNVVNNLNPFHRDSNEERDGADESSSPSSSNSRPGSK